MGLHARLLPGQEFSLETQDLQGSKVHLGGKGAIRVIELWATWCEPCSKADEVVRRISTRFPEVRAIGVSVDTDPATAQEFIASGNRSTESVHLPGGMAAAKRFLGVTALPFLLVLDREGRVVGTTVGYTVFLESKLAKWIQVAAGDLTASTDQGERNASSMSAQSMSAEPSIHSPR
jgi:thiol-disulfide isomerase/thioredoxin